MAQTIDPAVVRLRVVDENGSTVAGVQIETQIAGAAIAVVNSDVDGKALVSCGGAKACSLVLHKDGYRRLVLPVKREQRDYATLEIELATTIHHTDTVDVRADVEDLLATSQYNQSKLSVAAATESPLHPATLIDALPLVSGVVRTPDGRVKIGGADEQHNALIVNAVDVTDPATGDFGLSVPIDTVETVRVMQSPYLAQYGSFSSGVVSTETRRGGEKWKYSLNDPLPEFRIRSGHLVGARSITPRLNLSGPLIRNRLYAMDGTEYLMHKYQVRTLPFPVNETKATEFNSFTQFDLLLGGKQTLTATLHFAPRTTHFANLNFFNPQSVTPNTHVAESAGAATHRWEINGGLLSSTFSATNISSRVRPQAVGTMALSPVGDTGSYFTDQNGVARRWQWLETWNPRDLRGHGQHSLQFGTVLGGSTDGGVVSAREVELRDGKGTLLQTISYDVPAPFRVRDIEPALYVQDHWRLNEKFTIDAGVRWDWQSLASTERFAPRMGFAWAPLRDRQATVIRGGIGKFYDHVPLNTYVFRSYPQQTVTTYDVHGNVVDGPRHFGNMLNSRGDPISPGMEQGNFFAPYSLAWNLELERTLHPGVTLRLRYLQSSAKDQLTLQSRQGVGWNALVLGGTGKQETRQLDVVTAIGVNPDRRVYFSYVRQSAHGTLSDEASYLGAVRYPVVRSQDEASASGELPNRFLFWGTRTLPSHMRISPHVEYRSGFPYQPVDVMEQYVPFESYVQPRYPRYFSLDARIARDFNVGTKHAVRLSLNGVNLSNHSNYLQVHNNVADPQYGRFFGNYGRHLLVDFDFLF